MRAFSHSSSAMIAAPMPRADGDHRPRQLAAEHALGDRRHQRRLRRGQRVGMLGRRRTDAVGRGEQVQHRRHDQRAGERADAEHQLLLPRRGADDVTGLEVLQVVAADRRRAAHHRADHDRGDRADRRVAAEQQHQHQRGEQDRGDGDARHRVVRRTDQAGQVRRHRHEQEAGDDHDDRHRDAHRPAADDGLVQQRTAARRTRTSADQHPLHRQVALGLGDGQATALARRGQAAA